VDFFSSFCFVYFSKYFILKLILAIFSQISSFWPFKSFLKVWQVERLPLQSTVWFSGQHHHGSHLGPSGVGAAEVAEVFKHCQKNVPETELSVSGFLFLNSS